MCQKRHNFLVPSAVDLENNQWALKEKLFLGILSIFLLVVGVEKDIIKAKPTEKFISMNLFKIICVVTWV